MGQPLDQNTLTLITQILTLFNGLAPSALVLIQQLATDLQGKSDAEILADANNLYQTVIDRAKVELAKLPS